MISFKDSLFHNLVRGGEKVAIRINDGDNKANFYVIGKDKEKSQISTDTIDHITMYIRVILNTELLNFKNINQLSDDCKEIITHFLYKNDLVFDDKLVDGLISKTGPVLNGKVITKWLNLDIPFIQSDIDGVNDHINRITEHYREICTSNGIPEEEMFSLAKFVAKIVVKKSPDTFNTLIAASYQKPNYHTNNIIIHSCVPNEVNVKKNMDNKVSVGCEMIVSKSAKEDNTYETLEIVFDDRVRLYEIAVQRFVYKGEDTFIPYFTSRNINIFKADKFKPLIRNNKGAIRVRNIIFNMKEFPKTTGLLDEYISKFLTAHSKLRYKIIEDVSKIVGKVITNKVMTQYNNKEELVQ